MTARTKVMAAVAAVAVAIGGIVIIVREGPSEEPEVARGPLPGPMASPSPSLEPPGPALRVRVGRVSAVTVGGRPRRPRLRAARRGVERTIGELYTRAFLEPVGGGGAPRIDDLFVPQTRRAARRDSGILTLGDAAARITAVRAPRARLDLRVLTDRGRRPTDVVARVRFAARAFRGEIEDEIRHRGSYLLRRAAGRWRIVSYDVRGRIPPARKVARPMGAPATRRGVLFILAIGSDARPGERVAGARADSLHIIGVNFRKGSVGIVGIPRDSFVPIPGVGTRKINEALFYGGPELTVRTVERLSGIRIDAYLLTGFQGFRSAVTGVGGVRTVIPYAMSDAASEAFFRPGRRRLGGRGALAFSRNRHDAPGGDFGRSLNQGRLLMAALREFRSDLRKDPAALLRWVAVGARNLQTDLSLQDTLGLLLAATSVDLSKVRNTVVSGSGAMVGGQSIVRLGSGAQATFRDLRTDGLLNGR
ncbi:MAG TPA: LCP family protein [Actinomycetota bacterium]